MDADQIVSLHTEPLADICICTGGRALGPFLSGALWAGAVSIDIPGQQYLAFGFPVLGFLSCYWLIYSSLQMPPDA